MTSCAAYLRNSSSGSMARSGERSGGRPLRVPLKSARSPSRRQLSSSFAPRVVCMSLCLCLCLFPFLFIL